MRTDRYDQTYMRSFYAHRGKNAKNLVIKLSLFWLHFIRLFCQKDLLLFHPTGCKRWRYSDSATHYGGAWGERRYSFYSFLNSALDEGELSVSCPGRALPPGKWPPVPTVQEAGWTPEPVWTQRLEEKSSAFVGDRTPVVQSVVRHYTDWATPAHPLGCTC
jgi:hypothetical protein